MPFCNVNTPEKKDSESGYHTADPAEHAGLLLAGKVCGDPGKASKMMVFENGECMGIG